ncbi:hypothetical protein BB561_002838 [Smittium simulii]|uniref:EF-hand domain-containing protein n=1 Tax=Smittium simulii TaxID=133385 RepID=A0A2T9YNY6_9FUNG|nr:hypothetical protein BB561_002838 [Smittium simulii]
MSYQGYQGGYGPPPPAQGSAYSRAPMQGSGYGAPPNNGPTSRPPPAQGYGQSYGSSYNPGNNPRPSPGYGQNQNAGGFRPAARPPPPNPQSMDPQQQQLYYWFVAVDTDRSGVLEADELQRALINGDWSPFSIDTVRLMITMFDADLSGTIDFYEFCGLWRYIEDWKKCFRTFDRDGSGSIDRRELFDALNAFGFRVPTHIVDNLIKKMDMLVPCPINLQYFIDAKCISGCKYRV